MTLKDLCFALQNSNTIIDRDLAFSEFFHSIKNGFDGNILSDFNKDDLCHLDIHSLCHVLSVYECILNELGISSNGILNYYKGVVCPMEENAVFIALSSCMSKDNASALYNDWLLNSIEPFKSRGIIAEEFNYAI